MQTLRLLPAKVKIYKRAAGRRQEINIQANRGPHGKRQQNSQRTTNNEKGILFRNLFSLCLLKRKSRQ